MSLFAKKVRSKTFRTRCWRPGEDYLDIIVDTVKKDLRRGDILIVSEKAVSTACGNLVDESKIEPRLVSKFIASFWMRIIWGYFLSIICHLKPVTVRRLRMYPLDEGAHHKEMALRFAGLLQALRHGSEGGIDVSNLPFSYACLPLRDAESEAKRIAEAIKSRLKVDVTVMISDTDMTYSFHNIHFTPRPNAMRGIFSCGGVLTYTICRFLKLKPRATPVALSRPILHTEHALHLAEVAHHRRGYGAGRTVWDVSERFGVPLTSVSWDMLDSLEHRPLVLIRISS